MIAREEQIAYLCEVNNLSLDQHRECLNCITKIKNHLLKHLQNDHHSGHTNVYYRLMVVESLEGIHQSLLR